MQTQAVHTPGPWRVDDGPSGWMIRCPCRGLEDVRDADGKVCDVAYRPNAYLIAAAPDLLAVCEGWIGYLDAADEADDARTEYVLLQGMRLAIAKALGAAAASPAPVPTQTRDEPK